MSTSERKYDLTDTPLVVGSCDGWAWKTWKRIGTAEAPKKDGSVTLYGIYGVRGDEVYAQYCGQRLPDGSVMGVSLMSSSADLEVYFWAKAEWFPAMWINGKNVVSEVTDEQ